MISCIIPLYNESGSLKPLYFEIKQIFNTHLKGTKYEIIFINDGSSDNSFEILKKIKLLDQNVKIISLRKNVGKASALQAGFLFAKGKIIVTIDADLQDLPSNIPLLLNKLEEGFDLVVGWKKIRNDPWSKKIPSLIFNLMVRLSSRLSLHDFNCGLKVMKKEVVQEIYLYGEMHRFIPVLAHKRGFKVTEVIVKHDKRAFGQSKYGWERNIRGFFDFITIMYLTGFGQRPLHFFGLIGIFSIFFGSILGIYLSILHFQGESIGRRPLLILAVLLIVTGLQLLSIGLIAEMIVSRSKDIEKIPIEKVL